MLNNTKTHRGLTFRLKFTQEHIAQVVQEIAQQVNAYYDQLAHQEPLDLVVVCVLKGAFMFFSDLVRLLRHPSDLQFVQTSSYVGTESTK